MRVLVLGASTNEERYSNLAVKRLKNHGHEVIAVGNKTGEIEDIPIIVNPTADSVKPIDTITLYLGPRNQKQWEDFIISINPKRIIFNPGTESAEFENKLSKLGIEVVEYCTLMLLQSGQF
ncbi:MAG: CoA-binding protein [Bacteroidales bacterium]|jgi:predicted CoA-binding protein|nr:CoA-binding protein [Bacteroidales bacterium]MDI3479614.1 hypothetical protein [Rikenellaceae bacterium]